MLRFYQWCIACCMMLMVTSCASYRQQTEQYYQQLQKGNYSQAKQLLKSNKLLNTRRNQLLLFFEKGYLYHVANQPDSSNFYFNLADALIEEGYKKGVNLAISTLGNPMLADYKAEDYERFMMHYYKALNYWQLGNIEAALVEARRITLANNSQKERYNNNNRYQQDAFALNLQGILYEASGDINNAFIAYRNASEVYLADKGIYFGTPIPKQLQQSALYTAAQMGFNSERQWLEKQLQVRYLEIPKSKGGEAIIFIERGRAPIKDQENYFFTLIKDGGGYFFMDNMHNLRIPMDVGFGVDLTNKSLSDISLFRLALPKYFPQQSLMPVTNLTVKIGAATYTPEKAQDINQLAPALLRQRLLTELSTSLTRLLVKKLAEQELKKKDKTSGEILEAFNFLMEKADTRNWQSLPAEVDYVRVPLAVGAQTITIQYGGRQKELTVSGVSGKVQLLHVRF